MMGTKFEFEKELNYKLYSSFASICDIQAIDIYIEKEYNNSVKKGFSFQVPVYHSQKNLIDAISAIDKELGIPIIDYDGRKDYNFLLEGTIWLTDNRWITLEKDDEYGSYFEFHSVSTIKEELLTSKKCVIGKTTITNYF